MHSRSESKYMAAKPGANHKNVPYQGTTPRQAGTTKTEIQSIDGQIEFTWSVEGPEFENFLSAEPGEGFESAEFSYSDGIWKLKCYPNGTKKYGQGNVSLFLAAVKLPLGVVQLGVQYEFECKEVNYKDEYGSELTNIFNKKHSSWGYPETFKRNLLVNLQKKNISKFTIKCCMKRVLMVSMIPMLNNANSSSSIASYHSDSGEILSGDKDKEKINKCSHNVTWFIDSLQIAQFKLTSSKKSFDSTAFQLHRTKWCLQCYPAGDKYANTGMVSLYLKVLEFPDSNSYHIKNMKVRMQFECPDIQYQSNEFIHIYENKKQEVYFGISSAFNTFQLNYLTKNQGIAIKCRIDLLSVSIDGERWWHCIRERDALKAKAKRIEHEAKEQNKKLQTSYVCNKVITIKEQQSKIRDKIAKLNDESRSILGQHEQILKQWDLTTACLQKVIENNCDVSVLQQKSNDAAHNKKEEDRKEDPKNKDASSKSKSSASAGYKLLNEYTQCQHLIDEQRNRLEMVSKNVYSLLNQQTNFLQSMEEWKENQVSMRNEYTKLLKKYNDVRVQRMESQRMLQRKVNECNAQIDEENGLNRKKCNVDNELNAMSLEIKAFEAMSAECKTLIERYNVFVHINNENIEKLHQFVSLKWSEFERNWTEWNSKDIMAYIKYKMNWTQIHLLHIDLNGIELNMIQQQMNGQSLMDLDKNDLYSIGITNYQLRCQIFDHIRVLRTKYAAPPKITRNGSGTRQEINSSKRGGAHGGGDANNNKTPSDSNTSSEPSSPLIPSKFLCPITHNLMTEPVMAFDGYTYEKSAIEQHLKKYKKSPKTNKHAHTLCTFPNLQLKQEIETFRAVNDIDGDGDTRFIE